VSWPVGALCEVAAAAGRPNRLDVAYFTLKISDGGLRDGWARYQYGVDYNHPDERPASLEHLRKSVDAQMKKLGHEDVEWVLPQGGYL